MHISLLDSSFFSFLVGDTLLGIARITVTVPEGTWDLSDSLLFRLETQGIFQVIVEVDGQDIVKLHDEEDVQITGEYDDLVERRIEKMDLPELKLPDQVVSIVEFKSMAGKVIGVEVQLTRSAFSVLLYPEDVEIRPMGAIWEFVRKHGLRECSRVNVSRLASTRLTDDTSK